MPTFNRSDRTIPVSTVQASRLSEDLGERIASRVRMALGFALAVVLTVLPFPDRDGTGA